MLKVAYEQQVDTNAYTDSDKNKLAQLDVSKINVVFATGSEVLTGDTWVDAKVVYRDVIDCSAVTNGAVIKAGVSTVIKAKVNLISSGVAVGTPPNDVNNFWISHDIATGNVFLNRVGTFSTPSVGDFVILEYTKV